MAFFPERGTDGGALFLNHGALVGDGLGRSNISNELFDYSIAMAATRPTGLVEEQDDRGWMLGQCGGGQDRENVNTYGMPWRSQGPPTGTLGRQEKEIQ